MPHFDAHGNDTWICQKCATIKSIEPPQRRPDIHRGNVCGKCVAKHDAGESIPRPTRTTIDYDQPEYELAAAEYRRAGSPPISLHEHCREESGGLTGRRLDEYVNRYYGLN